MFRSGKGVLVSKIKHLRCRKVKRLMLRERPEVEPGYDTFRRNDLEPVPT